MLDELLPTLDCGILRSEVRRFHSSAFGFDRLGWSVMLLCDFVSDADDGAMRRGLVEVVIEVFEGPICGLWVQEIDDGNEGKIEHGEHCSMDGQHREMLRPVWRPFLTYVELVSEITDAHTRELSADKAEDPVGCDCGGCTPELD
jgi:hypothetical protein